jgi:hypothetical protein
MNLVNKDGINNLRSVINEYSVSEALLYIIERD